MKQIVKDLLPAPILTLLRRLKGYGYTKTLDASFSGKDPTAIFTTIYSDHLWGKPMSGEHMSGHGSHDPIYVVPYISGVREFISGLPESPVIVDLGCGDFSVGSQLVGLSSRYVACDVVVPLIESLKVKYPDPKIHFRVVDITKDELPEGDVAIVRQVLQHMSNEQISAFVKRIGASSFDYLIAAEYIPKGDFVPNLDQPCGVFSRLARGIDSGVVLTAPPFNLHSVNSRVLSETEDSVGMLRTTVYRLR